MPVTIVPGTSQDGAQDEQVVDTTLVIVHKRSKPLFLKKYQYAKTNCISHLILLKMANIKNRK